MRAKSESTQIIKSKLKKQGNSTLRNCRVMCTDNRGSFTTNRSSFQ